jgi:TRAP-type C4-dicarboxylate transport system permease small subunit
VTAPPQGDPAAGQDLRPRTRALAWLWKFEDLVLAALVAALVLVAGGQIVLRAGFDSGLSWADALLRTLILWTALLGAMVAAREDKHLGVDAIPRLMKGVSRAAARFITCAFTAAIAGALAWYSVGLVQLEYESQTIAFAGVPAWITQLIMPFAFGAIALRYALRAIGLAPSALDDAR